MADTADYRRLPDAIRDARRIAAHSRATLAREHYVDLLVAEAGIAAQAVHPDLARLVFQLGQDVVGSSVTLIAAYAPDGHQLWHTDDGQEWPDESLVTDHLAAAADTGDGYFPAKADANGLFHLDLGTPGHRPDPVDGNASPQRQQPVTGDVDPNGARIRDLLELSTAHLPQHLGSAGLSRQDGVIVNSLRFGWLMWVPPDPHAHAGDHPQLPAEVLTIYRYARGLDCDYVLFDADADQVDDLPIWDW